MFQSWPPSHILGYPRASAGHASSYLGHPAIVLCREVIAFYAVAIMVGAKILFQSTLVPLTLCPGQLGRLVNPAHATPKPAAKGKATPEIKQVYRYIIGLPSPK